MSYLKLFQPANFTRNALHTALIAMSFANSVLCEDLSDTPTSTSEPILSSKAIAGLMIGGSLVALGITAAIILCLKKCASASCRETLSNLTLSLLACVTCQQECCCCGKDRNGYETIPS